jgi:hypothetical protein
VAVLGLMVRLTAPPMARADILLDDQTQLLGLTGRVAADEKSAGQQGATAVSLTAGSDKIVWIGVVKAEARNGDSFQGRTLLSATEGYTPRMTALGKPALLAKIEGAPVGSRIVVQGLFNRGLRSAAGRPAWRDSPSGSRRTASRRSSPTSAPCRCRARWPGR